MKTYFFLLITLIISIVLTSEYVYSGNCSLCESYDEYYSTLEGEIEGCHFKIFYSVQACGSPFYYQYNINRIEFDRGDCSQNISIAEVSAYSLRKILINSVNDIKEVNPSFDPLLEFKVNFIFTTCWTLSYVDPNLVSLDNRFYVPCFPIFDCCEKEYKLKEDIDGNVILVDISSEIPSSVTCTTGTYQTCLSICEAHLDENDEGFPIPSPGSEGKECPEQCYWKIRGNHYIKDTENFIGPTGGQNFVIKTGNKDISTLAERMRINGNGDVLFGPANSPNLTITNNGIINYKSLTITEEDSKIYFKNDLNTYLSLYKDNYNKPVVDFGSFSIVQDISENKIGLKLNDGQKLQVGPNFLHNASGDITNYLMSVGGLFVANEIVVTQTNGTWDATWPDYVFNNDYKIISISDLEKYIILNKKLPDLPTLDDVKKNGINIVDMQVQLLKKIEEMSLYIIELNKQNEELKEKIEKIKK
ncbi:MAG: hypothetical protein V1779_14210 [bacterium]